MENLIIPESYQACLSPKQTVEAVQQIKSFFSSRLASGLNLQKVDAPLMIEKNSGLSDVTDGHADSIKFHLNGFGGEELEIVRSATKWKRQVLANLEFDTEDGILAEVVAIRPDEMLSNVHSFQVDQWDWEIKIGDHNRTFQFIKEKVKTIYSNIVKTEQYVSNLYPEIAPCLNEQITFISSEELRKQYPHKSPSERESDAAKKFGSVFIVGIGNQLSDGKTHGYRAADYDDWSTESGNGYVGLNGDLIVWNPTLKQPLELSSMGIRVDKDSLLKQVKILKCEQILEQPWHKQLLNGEFPNSIGGGIGISRLCMFLLRKAHIGEVQFGTWPDVVRERCFVNGIKLL